MGARHPSIEAFVALAPERRRAARVLLTEQVALRVWREFVTQRGRIRYRDSVTGGAHELDAGLPARALGCLHGTGDADAVAEAYREPIAALQDLDLELPEHSQFAYYAIYNLFRRYGRNEAIEEFLIINQVLSSLRDEQQMAAALRSWP